MAKILVVDNDVQMREMLRSAFTSKGYEATTVPSAKQALELISAAQFDLVIFDPMLAEDSGIAFLTKAGDCQRKVPVVMYSDKINEAMEKRVRAAGAHEVLHKSAGVAQLVETAGKIIAPKERVPQGPCAKKEKKILIVDDEQGIRYVLSKFFASKGYTVREAENGQKAVEVAGIEQFSVVLLDINMPVMDGLETLKKLLEINPALGVIMVTAEEAEEKVKKALELGAYGYVLKPFDFLYVEMVVASKLHIAQGA